ncbi:MAG TPA: hypothetical protein VHC45_01280 [Gaiellaceae bacterium]|nr:hypothetical protein [Gaiellaceae bacterium]
MDAAVRRVDLHPQWHSRTLPRRERYHHDETCRAVVELIVGDDQGRALPTLLMSANRVEIGKPDLTPVRQRV